jgi:hypothetical protein
MHDIDPTRLAAFADLQLITVSELAVLAQTGEDWINKGCQARILPFTLAGNTYRFTREQVAAIWAIKTRGTAAVPSRDEVQERRERAGRSRAAV